jgi:hypothetical protein
MGIGGPFFLSDVSAEARAGLVGDTADDRTADSADHRAHRTADNRAADCTAYGAGSAKGLLDTPDLLRAYLGR